MKTAFLILVIATGCGGSSESSVRDAGRSDGGGNLPGDPDARAEDAAPDASAVSGDDADTASQDAARNLDAAVIPDSAIPDSARPDASGDVRYVFATSQLYDGNLGGLAGADAKCQDRATAAGLPGTYRAWLSDATTAAADRLSHATQPYVLVDGTVVAHGWRPLLLTGRLLHAIDLSELGTPALASPGAEAAFCTDAFNNSRRLVWSDTADDGTSEGQADCAGWHDPSARNAGFGSPDEAGVAWTSACGAGAPGICAVHAALYCFQQ